MENRIAKRADIKKRVFVEIDTDREQPFYLRDGNLFAADSADISSYGIAIQSRYFLPKGLVVDLKVHGTDFDLSEVISLEGEVRYCNYKHDDGYRCGLKLTNTRQRYLETFGRFAENNA